MHLKRIFQPVELRPAETLGWLEGMASIRAWHILKMHQYRDLHLGSQVINTPHLRPIDRHVKGAQFSKSACSSSRRFSQDIDSIWLCVVRAGEQEESAKISGDALARDLEWPRSPARRRRVTG